MIELHGVHKRFEEPLLRGIDLRVGRGETWGLVGPGASGKSVMLKIVCGLLFPEEGQVLVGGEEVRPGDEEGLRRARRRIGMLFQNNALFDFLDVLQNVAFPLVRAGVPRAEAEERAADRLRRVGLAGSERKSPPELSGGMKKRVGIARAGIGRPEVVIYDEPTAGLDPVTTRKIYDLMRADQEASGATVLVASSDVQGLLGFASKMGVLHDGRLRYDGPSDAVNDSQDPVVRQFVRGELEGPL